MPELRHCAIRTRVVPVLALLCATAHAGPTEGAHSICFQGEPQGGAPTGTFACHGDGDTTCSITPLGAAWTRLPSALSGTLPGQVAAYALPAGASTFSARIDFTSPSGGTRSRLCSVNLIDPSTGARGMASPGAQLIGYTTDASGLVSTGVWKSVSPTAGRVVAQTLQVPGDFVAVGGGVIGSDAPYGAFVVESLHADAGIGNYGQTDWRHMRQWVIKTADVSPAYAQTHRHTGYIIGMRVDGRFNTLTVKGGQRLKDVLQILPQEAWPAAAAWPQNDTRYACQATASGCEPFVLLSGSVQAVAQPSAAQNDNLGQFVTATSPAGVGTPDGYCALAPSWDCTVQALYPWIWHVRSKDHLVSRPGVVHTSLLTLPPRLEVDGRHYQVVSGLVARSSPTAAHPTATVGGLKGLYALTGVGASVDSRAYLANGQPDPAGGFNAGNLIWRIEPRPDVGGATVASKDFAVSAPTRIVAWAMGIRLLPLP